MPPFGLLAAIAVMTRGVIKQSTLRLSAILTAPSVYLFYGDPSNTHCRLSLGHLEWESTTNICNRNTRRSRKCWRATTLSRQICPSLFANYIQNSADMISLMMWLELIIMWPRANLHFPNAGKHIESDQSCEIIIFHLEPGAFLNLPCEYLLWGSGSGLHGPRYTDMLESHINVICSCTGNAAMSLFTSAAPESIFMIM